MVLNYLRGAKEKVKEKIGYGGNAPENLTPMQQEMLRRVAERTYQEVIRGGAAYIRGITRNNPQEGEKLKEHIENHLENSDRGIGFFYSENTNELVKRGPDGEIKLNLYLGRLISQLEEHKQSQENMKRYYEEQKEKARHEGYRQFVERNLKETQENIKKAEKSIENSVSLLESN